jgi:hypothetical protein
MQITAMSFIHLLYLALQAYWQRVLHSYDKDNTGLLSVKDFRDALDRLNVALTDEEKAKVGDQHLPGQHSSRTSGGNHTSHQRSAV